MEATLARLDARKAAKGAKAAEKANARSQPAPGVASPGASFTSPHPYATNNNNSGRHNHLTSSDPRESPWASNSVSGRVSFGGDPSAGGEYDPEDYAAADRLRTPSMQGTLAVEQPWSRPRPLAGFGPRHDDDDDEDNGEGVGGGGGGDGEDVGDGLGWEDRLRYCDNSDEEADEKELADLLEVLH